MLINYYESLSHNLLIKWYELKYELMIDIRALVETLRNAKRLVKVIIFDD